jgi:hypothetical protein
MRNLIEFETTLKDKQASYQIPVKLLLNKR